MNEVETFFAKFNVIADGDLSNEEYLKLVPIMSEIINDYKLRDEFIRIFRGINDEERKDKILEAFNFARAAYAKYEKGVISENELQRLLAGGGGLTLLVGATIATMAGTVALLTGIGIIIGAVAILAIVGYYIFESYKKIAESAERKENMDTFIRMLNADK